MDALAVQPAGDLCLYFDRMNEQMREPHPVLWPSWNLNRYSDCVFACSCHIRGTTAYLGVGVKKVTKIVRYHAKVF
jgi:hypothetical protein